MGLDANQLHDFHPSVLLFLVGKIRETYSEMVVSDVKYCSETMLLLLVNNKSLYLQWLSIADCHHRKT